jgi:hypothetical protein
MDERMEDTLLDWIRASRNRQFELIIAGRLSGIHGWKRTHVPIAFQVIDSTLVIHFDGSERLTISDASGVALREDGGLQVRDTSEARFLWCSEKDSDRECGEVFVKFGKAVVFNRTDDLYATATVFFRFPDQFVVLR